MTEKYYVEGVIEIDGTCGRWPDEDAEFFTLYERDGKGLSLCLADFTDRQSAEEAMAVYQERDALQQQVSALAAENALIHSQPSFAAMMQAIDAFFADEEVPERAMLAAHKILLPKRTPATDAVINELMAQGASMVSTSILACIDEFPDSATDIVQECANIAEDFANQLRAQGASNEQD